MRPPVCLAAAAFTLLLAAHPSAQADLTINDVMSQAEQRAVGLHTLTAAQRDAFNRWLARYTRRVLDVAQRGSPGGQPRKQGSTAGRAYAGVGDGHWIDEVSGSGAIVTLEDGSMWEISSMDRIDTSLWLPITDITVLEADRPIGEYRYLLVNTEDGEKALAKYIGSR